jgi:hypothetical protein
MKNYDINIIKNGVFWTGSAATNHHINGLNKNGDRSGVLFLWASDYGVRPAIVVSTSDIHTS